MMGVKHVDLTRKVKAWEDTWYSKSFLVNPAIPVAVQPQSVMTVPMTGSKQGLKNPIDIYAQYADISNWISFLTKSINITISGFLTFSFDVSGVRQVRVKHTTVGTELFGFEILNSDVVVIEAKQAVAELNQQTTVAFFREKFAIDTSGWDKDFFLEQISVEAYHSAPVALQITSGQITMSIEGESA